MGPPGCPGLPRISALTQDGRSYSPTCSASLGPGFMRSHPTCRDRELRRTSTPLPGCCSASGRYGAERRAGRTSWGALIAPVSRPLNLACGVLVGIDLTPDCGARLAKQ